MRFSSLTLAASLVATAGTAAAREPGPYDVARADATKPLPAGVKARGKVVEQVWTWTEGDLVTRGVAVLSSTDTVVNGVTTGRQLFVQYYRGKGGKLRQVRLVSDGVPDCEWDALARFVDTSVRISDEDADGVSELTFAYDLNCSNDLSPSTRKLLLLEGTAKHALRGESRVDHGGGHLVGGTYTVSGFKRAPALRAWAEAAWKDLLGT